MIVRALVRLPSASLADGERTHLDRVPIDFARALEQHRAYRDALAARGINVVVLPAFEAHPDAVFVEDTLLAFPELFVLTRPGAASRAAEPEAIAPHVGDDRPLVRLARGRVDGGDVLTAGRRVFIGLSSRTDPDGAGALHDALAPHGYSVETIAMAGALHLKTAVTALGDDTLVVSRAWLPEPPAGYRIIDADPDEPAGANLLWVNGHAFAQSDAPRTIERVRAAGHDVTVLEVSEFAKAEAGLTCMSVLVPAP